MSCYAHTVCSCRNWERLDTEYFPAYVDLDMPMVIARIMSAIVAVVALPLSIVLCLCGCNVKGWGYLYMSVLAFAMSGMSAFVLVRKTQCIVAPSFRSASSSSVLSSHLRFSKVAKYSDICRSAYTCELAFAGYCCIGASVSWFLTGSSMVLMIGVEPTDDADQWDPETGTASPHRRNQQPGASIMPPGKRHRSVEPLQAPSDQEERQGDDNLNHQS